MFLLDIFFPKRCVGCGRLGQYICPFCRKLLIPIPDTNTMCPVCEHPAFLGITHPRCKGRYTPDGLTSFYTYTTVVKKLVKAVKYSRVTDVSEEFVNTIPLMSYNIFRIELQNHPHISLIPIPLHWMKLRSRGFNQAEVLGTRLVTRLGISLELGILKRVQNTKPQVSMKNRKERLANMTRAFMVHSKGNVRGRSFIIFDDVFTTGATIRAATRMLKEAGASFVWAVTMAR
jgi:competence protein ComFC